MDRQSKIVPPWIQEEQAKLLALPGEQRLAARWAVTQRLSEGADIDGRILWIKLLLTDANKEARLDYKILGFGELRHMYASNSNHLGLRRDVLWYYKWLAEDMPKHADVSAEIIERVFLDMAAFYQSELQSLRPLYALRCAAAIVMGKPELATEWHEKWQAEPATTLDDCPACVIAREIQYLLEFQRGEEAIAAAEPILRGKVGSCDETPAALTRLIQPAIRLNRGKMAKAFLQHLGRPVRRTPSMLSALGTHVIHKLLTGDQTRSRRLAIVGLYRAQSPHTDLDRFNIYRACGMWAAFWLIAGIPDAPLPAGALPSTAQTVENKIALPDVAGACLTEARKIAARLDARNQTNRYGQRLEEVEGMLRKIVSAKTLRDSNPDPQG